MDKKIVFNTAHSRTRTIVAKNPTLKYRIVFSFQLKKAIAEQHKKVTTLHADKSVTVAYIAKPTARVAKKTANKGVAMVGDYKKPDVKNDNLALPFLIISSILIIFALTLQAINY